MLEEQTPSALLDGDDRTLDATKEVFAVRVAHPERDTHVPVGEILNGRYGVERAIGRGGMGWVYAVRDRARSGKLVALKTLGDFGRNAARRSLFKAEFSTMAKLEHPNVARVYDFEELRGSDDLFITMELIDGAPLHREKKRGWRELVDIAVQVCRALSYMHSRRIVHFDLKPANILVDAQGVAKVVDFGISGAEPVKRAGHVVGTLPYMAPELVFGGAPADYRADLYSLGITLYEILVGHVPCRTIDAYELGLWFKKGGLRIEDDPRIPPWLARIIERLCAVDPSTRFRNANAVIEAINAGTGEHFDLETVETRQSYIATPSFTGRALELERVLQFTGERLGGRGNEPALLVRGISGIGKSRLLLEARREAQLRGKLFLEANCYERSLVEYGPIADLLYQLVPSVEAVGEVELVQRALPDLVKIAPRLVEGREVNAAPSVAGEGERVRLLETTSAFFVDAARFVPIVIYLNDLQWAARGPTQMMTHLAMRVRDDQANGQPVRLAILGSYRSDEVDGRPLAQALEKLREQALAIELELEPLSASEVASVARSMLGIDAAPEAFVARLAHETGGNPFFVQEVMRALFENRSVYLEDGRWTARSDVGELQIPTSMAEVFRRRFALLADPVKDIVRVLAVHARPMRFELLTEILGDSSPTLEALRELEARSIAVRLEDKGVSHNIAHDRMRETIYGDLSQEERRSWHARIAQHLERLSEGAHEQPLDELAVHFRAAGTEDKALAYSIAAGRQALSTYANEAALEHLRYAVSAAPDDQPTRRNLAEALMRAGDTVECARTLREALAYARSPEDQAKLHAVLSRCERSAQNLSACIDEGWRALELLGEKRPRSVLSKLLRISGALLWLVLQRKIERPTERGASRSRAVAAGYMWISSGYIYENREPWMVLYSEIMAARHAAHIGFCDARMAARTGLGISLAWAGYPKLARKWIGAARKDAEELNSWEGQALCGIGEWGFASGHDGPEPDAEAKLRQVLAWARGVGNYLLPTGLCAYHFEMLRLGGFALGSTQHKIAMDYMRRSMPVLLGDQLSHVAMPIYLLHTSGRSEEAIAVATSTIERARARKQGLALQMALDAGAEPFAASGRPSEARAMLEEGWRRAKKARSMLATREAFRLLPRLYLSNDDRRMQKRAASMLREGWRLVRKGHLDKLPLVELGQAQLFEAKGKHAKADAFFARAVRTAREQGVRFYLSDILHQRGLARLQRGDTDGAARDLTEARAIAADCGDVYVTQLCDGALSSAAQVGSACTPR